MITPCIQVCRIENGICKGCKRTPEQIRLWSKYTDDERLEIMRSLGYAKKRVGRVEKIRRYDRG